MYVRAVWCKLLLVYFGLVDSLQIVRYNRAMIKSYFNKCTIPTALLHLADNLLDYKLLTNTLLQAIRTKQQIVNVCDTDTDGLFSGYIYRQFAIRNGIAPKTVFAERSWGYGISPQVVERIPDNSVVLTSDVGIATAKVYVDQLKAKGCSLLITDHHLEGDYLPEATAIVNPNRHRDPSVLKEISGTVVLASVLIHVEYALTGKLNIEDYLIPMAITTISDVMPLNVLFNRVVVKEGLKAFSTSDLPFVETLKLNIKKLKTSEDVAFQLVPRINAAYRLSMGRDAFKFLDLGSEEQYLFLDQLNTQRKELVASAVASLPSDFDDAVIFYVAEDAPKGILGLIASKLVETFNRPAVCLAKVGDNLFGSGRSSPDVNLYESLLPHKDKYISFGGHHQALGIGFKAIDLPEIKRLVQDTIVLIPHSTVVPPKAIQLSQITSKFVSDLEAGEPYGQGCPRPVFETLVTPTAVKYYSKVTQIWVGPIVFLDFTCSQITSESLSLEYTVEDVKTCLVKRIRQL